MQHQYLETTNVTTVRIGSLKEGMRPPEPEAEAIEHDI